MARIAVVAFNLNPERNSEAQVAAQWLKILVRSHHVEVFTDARHREAVQREFGDRVVCHGVGGTEPWRRLERWLGLRGIAPMVFFRQVERRLADRARQVRFDLLHCQTPFGVHSYNRLYRVGIPMIVGPLGGGLRTPPGFARAFRFQYLHDRLREAAYALLLKRSGWRTYLAHAERIIVGTGHVKRLLPAALQPRCVNVFDTVVDTSVFVPAPRAAHRATPRVLFVGRLESNKGPVLLLEAVRRCRARGLEGFSVELVGEGRLQGTLARLIERYRLQDIVHLAGALSRTEVLARYRAADIFCLPTLREPGGTVILEAMACGLPVITSDYGGPAEVVTPACGIKLPMDGYDGYVAALTEALAKLLTDPACRRRMGAAGRARATGEYSVTALEAKIGAVYRRVLPDAPSAAPIGASRRVQRL